MKKMTSKEFKELVSNALHYNCTISFEDILSELAIYSLYERDHYKDNGLIHAARHFDEAHKKIVEELSKRDYYEEITL